MTSSGKAPGANSIPAEIFKCGGQAFCQRLLKLFQFCWEKGELPQQFKDCLIVSIYKQKGDQHECGNHCGISLLSIASKIFVKILLCHLQVISEQVLMDSQCGFQINYSTIPETDRLGLQDPTRTY